MKYNKIYTAHLGGGLGNQLFQIAHTLCQSWKYDAEPIFLPVSHDNYPIDWKPFNFLNNIYRNIKFLEEINEQLTIVKEKSFEFDYLEFDTNQNTEFHGYFQSSKNFFNYKNDIRNIFSPTEEFVDRMNVLYPQLQGNTLSVHIRLGDYRNVTNILPIVDMSYIDESIKNFGEYDTLFIFSNEKDFVRENFNYKNSIIVDGFTNYEEMWLMSLCKNNIISNSTFSWWGSFLNHNIYKKIYAPSVWFGPDGPTQYSGIYEDYWNIIPVEYKNGVLIAK